MTEAEKVTIRFVGRREALVVRGIERRTLVAGRSAKDHAAAKRWRTHRRFHRLDGDTQSKDTPEPSPTRVVALSGVREIRLGYFGRPDPAAAPAWHADWVRAELLPDLVSIRIEFEDERRNEPPIIVALRQG